jgi:microcin C transport system permease protein
MFSNPSEQALGGDFITGTDWKDPFITELLAKPGNLAVFTLNPHSAIRWTTSTPRCRRPPQRRNWLGTDSKGRDMLARLIYGFRVSVWFALALTIVGTAIGVASWARCRATSAASIDLLLQRLIEIWGALPELYLLIIFASIFEPSLLLLLVLLSLFGWIGLSDYVRAEFLRNRNLEFVKAARALGLSNGQIIWRHVLPNSLTPVITFLPFRMSAAILALTSLDFLGLGVPGSMPSLGELLRQGKENLDAWWIIVPPSRCWWAPCCC